MQEMKLFCNTFGDVLMW